MADKADHLLALLLAETQFAQVRYSRRKDAYAEECRARWSRLMDELRATS